MTDAALTIVTARPAPLGERQNPQAWRVQAERLPRRPGSWWSFYDTRGGVWIASHADGLWRARLRIPPRNLEHLQDCYVTATTGNALVRRMENRLVNRNQ